jgi:hypothetical protein
MTLQEAYDKFPKLKGMTRVDLAIMRHMSIQTEDVILTSACDAVMKYRAENPKEFPDE